MSASSIGLPPQIEQQLVSLDKQVRDAAFIRGIGRLVIGSSVILGISFYLDSILDLNRAVRGGLLVSWVLIGTYLLWRCLIRPMTQAPSFPALAALIEKRHPELRERLTSLVELRGYEEASFAPGTSKLMQELLARQTVKVFDRLDVGQILPADRSFRSLLTGMAVLFLLFVPFWFNPDGYGLLWNRFFVPWGNLSWGATIELKVWDGDQTIARGADATIHVSIVERRGHRKSEQDQEATLLLNWRDEKGLSDSRRLEWDPESEQYAVTLVHVMRSLTFDVTTEGAKSGTYSVDVSDPPSLTRFQLQIEPAAYTGLPAKSMEGAPGELKVTEFSKLSMNVEFDRPVASAELSWPTFQQEELKPVKGVEQPPIVQQTIPVILSNDGRSGKVDAIASASGSFVVRAKNGHGLQNDDPARTLLVNPDLSPQIQIEGDGEPILVRPDETVEIDIDVRDDYGLTAVELHAETSTEIKHVQKLTAEELRDSQIQHRFDLDLTQFNLTGGQVVTYRIRAVDNRPVPNPQEVWSSPRLLMTNTSLKQLPDKELANAEKSLEDELTKLRTDVNQTKAELTDLHRKTEDESLGKKSETDKNEKLEELRQKQEKLVEQIEQLSHRLAERGMTQNLAEQANQIADENLKKAEDKVQQSKDQPARDQLEPLAQAIDHLGNADRQLAQLEQKLNELNKLEQDLAELSRMAQRAERMADQLEKLDPNKQSPDAEPKQESKKTENQEPQKSNDVASQNEAEQSKEAAQKNSDQSNGKNEVAAQSEKNPAEGQKSDTAPADKQLQQLKDESQKLTNQLNDLLKKHPEILDAARKDQVDRLNQLGEQAKDLGEQQNRLAQALQKVAENTPAKATQPENTPPADNGSAQAAKPDQTTDGDKPSANPSENKSSENSQSEPQAKPDSPEGKKPANEQSPSDPTKSNQPADGKTRNNSDALNANTDQAKDQSAKPQQQGADAVRQQEQLARSATEQALDMVKETGSDSNATKAATEFARQADAARENSQTGDLKSAAKQAEQAAQAADDTAKSLNPDGQSNSPQSAQAKQLADQQRQVADQLKKLADSNEATQGAQLQGQKQLSEATKRLTEQLQQSTDALNSAPLNLSKEAGTSEQAKQSAQKAQQAMNESEQANRQNDPAQAAKSASEAVDKLKEASETVKQSNPKPNASPVSKQIAKPVTDAVKQLETAQKSLSQCDCQNPSASGQNGSPKAGQSGSKVASNDSKPSASQDPSQKESEPTSSGTSELKEGQPSQANPSDSNSNSKDQGSPKSPAQPGQVAGKSEKSDQVAKNQSPSKSGPGEAPADAPGNKDSSESHEAKESEKGESQFTQASNQFRSVAKLLRQARGGLNEHSSQGQSAQSQPSGQQSLDKDGSETSQAGDTGDVQNRTAMAPDLRQLDAELQQQNQQNWGRLPGQLRTEILQGASKKSHSEYKQRIKAYFDEISKPAK